MFLSYGLSSASLNARSTSPPASFIIPRYHPSPVLSFQPSFSLELYLVHQIRPSHRGKKIRIRTVIARVKSDLATIPADSSSSVDLRTFLFVSLVSLLDNHSSRSSRESSADDTRKSAFSQNSFFIYAARVNCIIDFSGRGFSTNSRNREKERFVEIGIGGFMGDLREMKSRDKFKEVEERIKRNRNFNISCHLLRKIDRLDDSCELFEKKGGERMKRNI